MLPDTPQFKHDIFISYARRDAEIGALRLESALKQRQPSLRLWRDELNLDPTQYFTTEIEEAIEASRCMVVCITPRVQAPKSFVQLEIGYAVALEKPIYVARFSDTLPPILLIYHTRFDLFNAWEVEFNKLWDWLNRENPPNSSDRAAPASMSLATDPYYAYVKTLYADVVENLRSSVFSVETITLKVVESEGDVPRPVRRITPRLIPYAMNQNSQTTDAIQPASLKSFASLHEAYVSSGCNGRVLLLGEPGAGKTTSLLAFARDAAAARLCDPSNPLPVFARVSGWNAEKHPHLARWLASSIEGEGITPEALSALIDNGSALLLLDGLDELGSRRSHDPEQQGSPQYDPRIDFLSQLPESGRVILSSRKEEYRQIGSKANLSCAVGLERLDDEQMQGYLADVPGSWNIVANDHDLKDALRTPLLLALFRKGYELAPEAERDWSHLSAGELIERIFDVFIDERWAFEQAHNVGLNLPLTASELKLRLGIAAANAINRNDGDDTVIRHSELPPNSSEVIALAQRLDLLRPGSENGDYRFLHLYLRDALAFKVAVACLGSKDDELRLWAVKVLRRLDKQQVVEPLIPLLSDPNRAVRSQVIELLGKLGDKSATEALMKILDKTASDSAIRKLAIDALGSLSDTRAINPLLGALHDPDSEVRRSAAITLGRFKDERIVEALIAALSDPDPQVCRSAAHMLGRLRDPRAVEPLISTLQNSLWRDVWYSAIDALEELKDERAIQPLITALHGSDTFLSLHAATALRQFSDHPDAKNALAQWDK